MPAEPGIRFHNVLPSRAMIEEASRSADETSPQLAMAKAVFEFVSTEDGRKQFGDAETGSTLDQIWRLRLSTAGVRLVCLVATGRSGLDTTSVSEVVPMDPAELVDTMARLLTDNPASSLHPFVFDGNQGYATSLLNYDPNHRVFTITEPDPSNSTIGTTRKDDGSWVIHADDLTKTVCAVFLPPPIWADLNGVHYAITYASFKSSEMWSFFGIRELKRQDIGNDQQIVFLEPGGFKNENRLQLRLDKDERVRGAVLLQARPWMMSQSVVNPFALDLAKDFVKYLTPAPDDTSDLVSGIWALRSMEELNKLNITPSSEVGMFLQAYVGAQKEGWILKDFVKIQAKTITLDKIKFMQLQMDHG